MGFYKTSELLLKARSSLLTLRDELKDSHEKLASSNQEIKTMTSVLELVKEGLIDPIDVFDKLLEFREDPSKPDLIKQAAVIHASQNNYSIGFITELGKEIDDASSAEEKLVSRVKTIVEDI